MIFAVLYQKHYVFSPSFSFFSILFFLLISIFNVFFKNVKEISSYDILSLDFFISASTLDGNETLLIHSNNKPWGKITSHFYLSPPFPHLQTKNQKNKKNFFKLHFDCNPPPPSPS